MSIKATLAIRIRSVLRRGITKEEK